MPACSTRARTARAMTLAALFAAFSAAPARAQDASPPRAGAADAPLWEIGVGAFGALTPNYPASGRSEANALPLPLFVYRGDVLRLGEDAAARLVPFDTARFELGVSADAAFGVESDDNPLREGLPDLDPLLEIGPELVLKAAGFGAPESLETLELALQGRAVFSVGFDEGVGFQGLVVEPQIRMSRPGVLGPGSVFTAAAGPVFATRALHGYFYDVPARFARPGRPAFRAEGGYLGSEVTLGLGYAVSDRLDLFLGGELGVHAGAANADSPLYERDVTGSVFIGASYAVFQSERRVAGPR